MKSNGMPEMSNEISAVILGMTFLTNLQGNSNIHWGMLFQVNQSPEE